MLRAIRFRGLGFRAIGFWVSWHVADRGRCKRASLFEPSIGVVGCACVDWGTLVCQPCNCKGMGLLIQDLETHDPNPFSIPANPAEFYPFIHALRPPPYQHRLKSPRGAEWGLPLRLRRCECLKAHQVHLQSPKGEVGCRV